MYQFGQRSEEKTNSQGISWNSHHVIAVLGRYVYDLSNIRSEPIPIGRYFVSMFGIDVRTSKPSLRRKFDWNNYLVAEEIPILSYLSKSESGMELDLALFRMIYDDNYSLRTISELLGN